ncbi:hypothetical protein BGZ92_000874, partial [Podila epicladia]
VMVVGAGHGKLTLTILLRNANIPTLALAPKPQCALTHWINTLQLASLEEMDII